MSTNRIPQTVVAALVSAGLLEPSRSTEAERVVTAALSPSAVPATPLRRRMSEIAGYVGGAFVVGAGVLFFSSEWNNLAEPAQVALLGGVALLLAGACGVLVVTSGGVAAVRRAEHQVRRRLASVLAAASAAAAGFAVGVLVDDPRSYTDDSRVVLAGAAAALAVAILGYRVAPSAVGQLAVAAAAFTAIPSALDTFGSVEGVALGGLVLALGVVWLALAERGVWLEDQSGRVIGCLLAVLGGQLPALGPDSPDWVGYTVTAVVGVAAFGAYVVRPAWPYLAAGVVAVTLAVPEALFDWTSGSLGSAGVLLVTGLTLLGASLLGLRLRHEVSETGRGLF